MKKAIYLLFTNDLLNSRQRFEREAIKATFYTFIAGMSLFTALLSLIIWSV